MIFNNTLQISFQAVKVCCEELLKHLEPVKLKMPDTKWKEIVLAADNESINLIYEYMFVFCTK